MGHQIVTRSYSRSLLVSYFYVYKAGNKVATFYTLYLSFFMRNEHMHLHLYLHYLIMKVPTTMKKNNKTAFG